MATAAATPRAEAVEHKTLAGALVAAQRQAKAVGKDARNEHHKYAYASAEAVITEAREALNDNGLAAIQTGWNITSVDVEYTDNVTDKETGVVTAIVVKDQERTLHVRFALLHEGGEKLESEVQVPIIPERGRPLDKATFSALTYAESYWLRGTLCLARGNEAPDIDQRDDTGYQPRSASRPSAAPTRGSAKPNAHAGPCFRCGAHVLADAGTIHKEGTKWHAVHLTEAECAAATAGKPSQTELPKGCEWNTVEMTCSDSDCGEQIPAGAGFAYTTKEGKPKAIHAKCYARAKADN